MRSAPDDAVACPSTGAAPGATSSQTLQETSHLIAVTQVRHNTPGRAYYLRKQTEGHSRKEAMRALKRRISDAVFRQLVLDSHR